MKLICEKIDGNDIQVITESDSSGNKKLYIEGVFMQSNVVNRNKRIYPEKVMDKEVSRYIEEKINTRTAYGMLNHPDTPEMDLNQVSHIINSLRKEGTDWIGKALVITENNPGKVVSGLLNAGANVGVSSRGLGSVKPNNQGINEVQEDFRLITAADIVANPSAPKAYINGIMEGIDWVWDEKYGYKAIEIAEEHKKEINKNYKKLNEDAFLSMFDKYLKAII